MKKKKNQNGMKIFTQKESAVFHLKRKMKLKNGKNVCAKGYGHITWLALKTRTHSTAHVINILIINILPISSYMATK